MRLSSKSRKHWLAGCRSIDLSGHGCLSRGLPLRGAAVWLAHVGFLVRNQFFVVNSSVCADSVSADRLLSAWRVSASRFIHTGEWPLLKASAPALFAWSMLCVSLGSSLVTFPWEMLVVYHGLSTSSWLLVLDLVVRGLLVQLKHLGGLSDYCRQSAVEPRPCRQTTPRACGYAHFDRTPGLWLA